MVNNKAPLSRSMLLQNDVNVNVLLEGNSIAVVIPSALFTVQETGKLVNDDECVQMIYGSILRALSPDNCSWFSREKYELIQEFFELKMNPSIFTTTARLSGLGSKLAIPTILTVLGPLWGLPTNKFVALANSVLMRHLLRPYFDTT